MFPNMFPNPSPDWMSAGFTKPEFSMHEMLQQFGADIDPTVLARLQAEYFLELGNLWKDFLASKLPQINDRRFSSPDWQKQSNHAYNVASYLLNARFLNLLADAVQGPEKKRQKIKFAVEQTIAAMSPANFLATNPEAQAKLVETSGESLMQGLGQMIGDMQKGRISLTDEAAFEVGKNVATTEGAVVFENRLFQLIQYRPLNKTVHQRPLLMVPPCINKYYILDLQPENSLVRYAIEQGHTVFLVSWANPDESLSDVTWDDYVEQGAIQAIEVVQGISKQEQINVFGFCVGGTIVSTALAVLADRDIYPASSLTLLTTLLDFSETGVLDVFIDEMQVSLRERTLGDGGLLPARELASTFSSLRPNDLVWNYVQSNYLKGQKPPAFDLLYWNSDSTNLPGPMFCWYLRNTYLENSLKIPGKLQVAGNKVNLGKIAAPVFIFGSKEDHIVPWHAAYASCKLLNPKEKSQNRFVLGASGHIAGVINPASKNKRSYWSNASLPSDPEAWLAGATEHAGSWWPEWAQFLSEHGGKLVKAPTKFGNKVASVVYSEIEPAPGRYVKVRA
ncbi:MAG: class I poly(R)-hydroxyalkanoic acid synthase [Undibacterium sp.]|nr:class I poly(R)-hydroxyalkanoic acid synthase [Undibacterium sp.]